MKTYFSKKKIYQDLYVISINNFVIIAEDYVSFI